MYDGMVKINFTISNQVKSSLEKVVVSTVSLQLRDTFTKIQSEVQTTGYTQEREGGNTTSGNVYGFRTSVIVKMFIGLSGYF